MNLFGIQQQYMTETFTNPYGVGSFLGAVRPFEDASNSSPASRRRILEVSPDVSVFTEMCIEHDSVVYVVGGLNMDYWNGDVIRHKYPILPCDITAKIGSVLQVIQNTLPTHTVYAYPHYVRGSVVDTEQSWMTSDFLFYMSPYETVANKQIVATNDGKYYRLRSNPYIDGAGFQAVEAVLLANPVQTLTYYRVDGYDPTTETINYESSDTFTCFVEDAFFSYDHNSERFAKLEPGDKTITFKPPLPPRAKDKIAGLFILAVETLTDGSSVCHCRP